METPLIGEGMRSANRVRTLTARTGKDGAVSLRLV